MGDLGQLGRALLLGGVMLAIIGVVLLALARLLPGGPVSCFLPLMTSLLLSVLLTLLLNLWSRR